MSLKDDLSRRLRASIRRIGSEFRLLISSPTSSSSADFSRTRGRRGTLTGPVSHHLLQAKPPCTLLTRTLNPHHRAGESHSGKLTPNASHTWRRLALNPLGRTMIPPEVSYPGHFGTTPLDMTLAAYLLRVRDTISVRSRQRTGRIFTVLYID